MAFTTITLRNPQSGHIRQAPVGFSWTVLLFGFIPPLFRGDWKWAVILLILALLTWGISNVVFAFLYNKLYIRDLFQGGFQVKSVEKGALDDVAQRLGMDLPRLEESK